MNTNLLRYSTEEVYKPEFIVKKYTDDYIRIVYLNACRQSGFENICPVVRKKRVLKLMNSFKTWIWFAKMTGSILKKLDNLLNYRFKRYTNNLSRARNKIFEYCICNNFEYFVTLTIDEKKYDRFDLNKYYKDFSHFIRNYRQYYNLDIQYLFVPEQHKNGAWHMHGVIKGIPEKHFKINSNGFLDWEAYKNRFGYISLDKIKNNEACSVYMTKYITKDFFKSTKINKYNKLYYCSRGLKTAETVFRGNIDFDLLPEPSFENQYVKIYELRNKECL